MADAGHSEDDARNYKEVSNFVFAINKDPTDVTKIKVDYKKKDKNGYAYFHTPGESKLSIELRFRETDLRKDGYIQLKHYG